MLPKPHRLPIQGTRERRGKRFASPYGTLKVFEAQKDHSRFGIILGRGVAKRAVDRNNLRRLFFVVARGVSPLLPVADYLFIPNPPLGAVPRRDLQTIFKNIFMGVVSRKSDVRSY